MCTELEEHQLKKADLSPEMYPGAMTWRLTYVLQNNCIPFQKPNQLALTMGYQFHEWHMYMYKG